MRDLFEYHREPPRTRALDAELQNSILIARNNAEGEAREVLDWLCAFYDNDIDED